MKSIHKAMRVLALTAAVVVGVLAQANAAPIVSIDPASQTAAVGDTVTVDVVVSGLTDPIGGFSAVVSFNPAVLAGASFLVDPDGHFASVFDGSLGFDGADLDLFLAGDPVAQGTGFRLATITFDATGSGLSPLTLDGVVLSSEDGEDDMFPETEDGEVCVTAAGAGEQVCAPSVPEPGLLALLGAGVSALAVRRRKAAASRA